AAGDEDGAARGAPAFAGDAGGEGLQGGQPAGRQGFVVGARGDQREGREVVAGAALHGAGGEGGAAGEQCVERDGFVAEGGEGAAGGDADRRGRDGHAAGGRRRGSQAAGRREESAWARM